MLRRCVLELSSSGRSAVNSRGVVTAQTPFYLSSRRNFSNASNPSQGNPAYKLSKPPAGKSGPPQGSPLGQEPPRHGALLPKILLGGIVVGAAFIAANQTGFIDFGLRHPETKNLSFKGSRVDDIHNQKDSQHTDDVAVLPDKEPFLSGSKVEDDTKGNDKPSQAEDLSVSTDSASDEIPEKEPVTFGGNETHIVSQGDYFPQEDHHSVPAVSSEENSADVNSTVVEIPPEQNNYDIMTENQADMNSHHQTSVSEESQIEKEEPESQHISSEKEMDNQIKKEESESQFISPEEEMEPPQEQEIEALNLPSDANMKHEEEIYIDPIKETSSVESVFAENEGSTSILESSEHKNTSEDEKIVLDLIEAIHAAEKRQAEADFRIFEEEKQLLKEKYEKELRDVRAQELMYAEEVSILEKELAKERAKAVATIKMLQDKTEQNLRTELQRKEEEKNMQLQKAQELAKAELNAALAKEKSSQMEKIAEANLHINALCMAFYARSEEARQTHTIHKLALGALALEDALSKGLPIKSTIDTIQANLVDIKSDSFLVLVLSSLPEETLINGTYDKFQLNQKFDDLKGTIRHFSLIPPSGGGILTHTVASIASSIKIKESSVSRDGIESVISIVEHLLAEGNVSEAADALERGVSGTEAEGAVHNWVRQARNLAVTEQALALIKSYATSISLI